MKKIITVFHASNHFFKKPSIESIYKNRKNHTNGLLGLWCASKNDWIDGFGKYIYQVKYDKKNANQITYSDFKTLCEDLDNKKNIEQSYLDYRDWLLNKEIGIIEIVENSGNIDMVIIVDFNKIELIELT